MPPEHGFERELPPASRIHLLSRNLRGFSAMAHWAWLSKAQKARIIHYNALGVLLTSESEVTPDDDIPDDNTLQVKENQP